VHRTMLCTYFLTTSTNTNLIYKAKKVKEYLFFNHEPHNKEGIFTTNLTNLTNFYSENLNPLFVWFVWFVVFFLP
jgi:hypothetical protein